MRLVAQTNSLIARSPFKLTIQVCFRRDLLQRKESFNNQEIFIEFFMVKILYKDKGLWPWHIFFSSWAFVYNLLLPPNPPFLSYVLYAYMYMSMCVLSCRNHFSTTFFSFLRQVLSLNLELTALVSLAGQWALCLYLALLSSSGVTGIPTFLKRSSYLCSVEIKNCPHSTLFIVM